MVGIADDHTGKKYGRLTAIKRGPNSATGQTQWYCRCDCGNETLTRAAQLVQGKSRSCGCYQRHKAAIANTVHGYRTSENRNSPEYVTWANMIQRCTNPNVDGFKDYGGRGITVCERWRDFANFIADMGPKPSSEYSIERDNVNKNYEPGNCFWLPISRQAENRRNCIYIDLSGQRVTLKEASRRLGQSYSAVRHRIRRGKSPRVALGLSS